MALGCLWRFSGQTKASQKIRRKKNQKTRRASADASSLLGKGKRKKTVNEEVWTSDWNQSPPPPQSTYKKTAFLQESKGWGHASGGPSSARVFQWRPQLGGGAAHFHGRCLIVVSIYSAWLQAWSAFQLCLKGICGANYLQLRSSFPLSIWALWDDFSEAIFSWWLTLDFVVFLNNCDLGMVLVAWEKAFLHSLESQHDRETGCSLPPRECW